MSFLNIFILFIALAAWGFSSESNIIAALSVASISDSCAQNAIERFLPSKYAGLDVPNFVIRNSFEVAYLFLYVSLFLTAAYHGKGFLFYGSRQLCLCL
jgi:hypothetical protein